jgi:carboxymethylenebutenolidase
MAFDSVALMGEMVSFASNGGTADGYLAVPASGIGPGLLVIQEWWGLVPQIKDTCERLAGEGFVALAPDLYHGEIAEHTEMDKAGQLMQSLPPDRAARDMGGAIDYLLAHDAVTGDKVGVIGFCMGGGFAILAAGRGFDASAPNYGMAPKELRAVLEGGCPMVGSYGAKDGKAIRDTPGRLESTLTELGIDHDIKTYPGAGHSFMTEGTGRWAWTERVPGLRFVPGAADDAWDRVFAFFGRHLEAAAG